jgi:hypothetical protein
MKRKRNLLTGTVHTAGQSYTYMSSYYQKGVGQVAVVRNRWDTGYQDLVLPVARWQSMLATDKNK